MPSLSSIIGQASRGADLYFVFRFLRLLTVKYTSTNAYKLGIIDKKGKALKKSAELESTKEKSSYTMLHRMVWKIRGLMEKIPVLGKSILMNYAAALFLLKEQNDTRVWTDDGYMKSKLLEFLETDWKADAKFLKEEVDNMNRKSFSTFLTETKLEESQELQAMMALDDAGIEAVINRKGQIVIDKKDLKNAEKALKKSFRKGGAPEIVGEEVSEGWKKGKYTIKDDKGKILGTYSSGGKAQKAMDDLMQNGDYDKLEVAVVEEVEIEEGTVLDVKDVDKWMPEIKKGIDAPWVSIQKSTLGGDINVAIMIKLSLDPEKDWANKIYQNSRFAMVRLGANGEMEMFASDRKLKNMRKTKFKSAKDVTNKINKWIKSVSEEVQNEENIVETDMLQAKMALGDANIKHKEHQGKIIINKKDKKKASDALLKSFAKKGTPPELTIASGSFQEAQSEENNMDLESTVKQVVMGETKMYAKVDLKKLKKEYEDNEDSNDHTGNYLLLAKAFGTPADVKKVQAIMKRNEKQGSTSKTDMDWMYKNINPYYSKIRNEEVEVDEEVLTEGLKPLDKSVIDAFYYRKEKAGKLVDTDGDTLTKNGMGGQQIAKWVGRKIKITAVSDVKSTESILKYMKKSIPSGLLEVVEVKETNKNDKSDDGDGLDAVQPKAVKKKFKDRKDKDIDNDGDTDNSDKFLHKKRKAISKAIKKDSKNESKLYSFVKSMIKNKG